VLPNKHFAQRVAELTQGECLKQNGKLLAVCISRNELTEFEPDRYVAEATEYTETLTYIEFPWHIFSHNAQQIEADVACITAGRVSQPCSSTNTVIAPERVFIEPGARVECAILNASGGSIYIGKDAQIMEGALIRGPFALGEHATVKMAAKIYEGTTIGPHCKVGGEVQNSVLFGFSNKGHDGYLGNSVLGEWCNLGADTNNSNLKNDYSDVRVWNYPTQRFAKTGLQFCGLFMGDHSKSAINTMFNTGTVVGVSANVFGAGFPRNFIPSFSWGGPQGIEVYALKRAIDVAHRVYDRRALPFTEQDIAIFAHIFAETEQYRRF
jgi:UDP-N-acetylglucosamine diphosphorylase/glucosamine-1-phosphate N-acetyltransferase